MPAERLNPKATYPGSEFGSKRYQWTGEKRPPKAGEWYLSGSVITAYKAKGDISYPYHIAKEVELKACPCCNGSGKVVV